MTSKIFTIVVAQALAGSTDFSSHFGALQNESWENTGPQQLGAAAHDGVNDSIFHQEFSPYGQYTSDITKQLQSNNKGLDIYRDQLGYPSGSDMNHSGQYQGFGAGYTLATVEIPAITVTTQTETDICDEGAFTQCYKVTDCGQECWALVGDVITDDSSLSFSNACCTGADDDRGYIRKYRKTCGNDAILNDIDHPYDDAGVRGYPNDDVWFVDTDHVFQEGDLEAKVDAKVYGQVEDAISEVINDCILYAIREGLNGCMNIHFTADSDSR